MVYIPYKQSKSSVNEVKIACDMCKAQFEEDEIDVNDYCPHCSARLHKFKIHIGGIDAKWCVF